MNKLDILLKCIMLLFRERELENSSDDSRDLVKTILTTFKYVRGKSVIGGETTLLEDLKHFITDMINNPDGHDKITILQSLEIILKDKEAVFKTLEKSISPDMSVASIKRNVVTLRNTLNNYYTEHEITNLITRANYALTTGKFDDGENVRDYTAKLVSNLEALNVLSVTKDPGIVDELDISDHENMSKVLKKAKNNALGGGKLITGWKEINAMTQGGFRRGECVVINALQHKYKSGFTQSLFMQLASRNVPIMDDVSKKPLIIYISFEDDTEVYTSFMYKYLYYNENKVMPDMSLVTEGDIAKYISERLCKTGYHVKIMRVNPSEWTIKHMFNKIIKYEAEGYEIHAVLADYLAKLPTIGCTNTGPGGTEVRDLFNRSRNFFGSRRILFITPHQMSTEAKQLIRNGVPDANFVKEVAGKGYTELSKQIDQVVDLELYIHIASINRKPHLTIFRGKHRVDSILDEDKFYAVLPFPYKAPILENLDEPDTGDILSEKGLSDDMDF
jgi:hypothetical protein